MLICPCLDCCSEITTAQFTLHLVYQLVSSVVILSVRQTIELTFKKRRCQHGAFLSVCQSWIIVLRLMVDINWI